MGITSHFALDVMPYAVGEQKCDLCYGSVDTNREFQGKLGSASCRSGAEWLLLGEFGCISFG